jgi:hypothetical protein
MRLFFCWRACAFVLSGAALRCRVRQNVAANPTSARANRSLPPELTDKQITSILGANAQTQLKVNAHGIARIETATYNANPIPEDTFVSTLYRLSPLSRRWCSQRMS